jgi:hypothetical protein
VKPDKSDDKVILSAPDERTGWEWRIAAGSWPKDFGRFMGWIFLATALQYLAISVRSIRYTIHHHYALPVLLDPLFVPAFSVAVAVICGVAWWTIWKAKSSANGWGIAASLMYILMFLRQFIIPLRPVWGKDVQSLIIGIIGLVAFLWRGKQCDSGKHPSEPADSGTSVPSF